jgi:hypothetical protein
VVEPSAKYEDVKIPLSETIHGVEEVSGVLGVPRWWPTGSRVSVVIGHGANQDMNDPAIEAVHRELTEKRYLTLRFNFPFAEAGKRRPDDMPALRRTMRAAVNALGRDPTAAPAHLDAYTGRTLSLSTFWSDPDNPTGNRNLLLLPHDV